ncbi:hypothetical protein [Streptomyces hyaluromycini]|uniref:hypothetical protein n=1 Tax=Streptomyces hyaluromycini TaxID=1377993 RepID=UPI000B5C5CF9|nr:hypothetical protein [Streptomyces hyaluromycini]
MATVWLEKVFNQSDYSFTLLQNDGTWRPYCRERGKSYGRDEEIVLSGGDVLTFDHFFLPWVDWGRLRVQGPEGGIDFVVGPVSWSSLDNLRGFDDRQEEIFTAEMGPRGSWWSSSVSLHLTFHNDGMRWSIWSATKVGTDVLGKAASYLDLAATELIKKLIGSLFEKPHV